MEQDYICEECEAEFSVISENPDPVTHCAFCGGTVSSTKYDLDEDLESEDWDNQDRDMF